MSKRLNFTKSSVDQIAAPTSKADGTTGRDVYLDSKVDGLSLRVSSSGVKTFSLLRWIPGSSKPVRVTIGRFPTVSVEQARKTAVQLSAQIASGIDPTEIARSAKHELTFADLFALYLEQHAKPHKRTWKEDVEKYERFLSSKARGHDLASLKLSKVNRQIVASLHARIGATSPVAANRTLALISSVFGRASEWGYWDRPNPAAGIKRFAETERERMLSKEELPRFFEALMNEPSALLRDFFLVSLLTGARRGNVQSMRFDEIDFDSGVWTVSASSSKNKKAMHVVLTEPVLQILRRRRAYDNRTPFVFPSRGKHGFIAEPRKGWERLLDTDELLQLKDAIAKLRPEFVIDTARSLNDSLKLARDMADELGIDRQSARLPNIRPHDLRRTLGSWQAMTGASLPIIGKSLGHRSHASTQIYARLDLDPVRASVERATAAMLAAGGKVEKESENR